MEENQANPMNLEMQSIANAVRKEEVPQKLRQSQKAFPRKFQLSPDLSDGKVFLNENEDVVESWTYESTSMSSAEWAATVISFGLYYFMTRILLQRKRFYRVYVTNLNVIVKEEMTETSWGCLKLLMENQASFPISSLAFLSAEVMGEKACGLIPTSVILELRFGRYPVDSEYPPTAYRSMLATLFEPFAHATKAAYKIVFGINFDAPPIQLAVQLVKAIPMMAVPYMWIAFAEAFGMDLVGQACYGAYLMMIAALLDPSVGPRQATGTKDACVFHLEADVSEDSQCQENMQRVVNAITRLLPNRGVVDPTVVKPRLRQPLIIVPTGEKVQQINSGKAYGKEDSFIVLEDFLTIPTTETVYDACPINPYWTFSDIKRVLFSLGAYYITDMAGHIKHRANMIFTDRRIIKHSVLVSSFGGKCVHSKLDFWINDDFVNLTATEFKKVTTFRATAKNMGWLSFQTTRTSPFTMFVFRTLFRPRYRVKPSSGLTSMTQEEWNSSPAFKGSILTASALETASNKIIDVSTCCAQEIPSCLYSVFCCPKSPHVCITATDEALLIEDYRLATCTRSAARVFVVLPWSEVDGVYWQNFDAAGPNCCVAYMLSCCLPACFGYYGCLCCCCSPNGAKENNRNFYDEVFGYKGSTIAVCARGDDTFRLGMIIPHTFAGVNNNSMVNALIDAMNFRYLLNTPRYGEVHTDNHSAPAIMQVNGGGIGQSITNAMSDIASISSKAQQMVRSRSTSRSGSASPSPRGTPTAVAVTSATMVKPPPSLPSTIAAEDDQQFIQSAIYAAAPVEVEADAVPAAHWSTYASSNSRPQPSDMGFPLDYSMKSGYLALSHGEKLLNSWKVDTTHLEMWEVIVAILTFGCSLLYARMFVQYRRFYNINLTTERVLIKEEVFELRMCTVKRIMENQASFKLRDLSYISSQEVGPQWCGCIPAMREITLRFGRYPLSSEVAHSIDSVYESTADRSPWTVALAHAMKQVYGISEDSAPHSVMDNVLRAEQNPISNIQNLLNGLHFAGATIVDLGKQLVNFVYRAIINFIFSKIGSVGPSQVAGEVDSRSFTFLFKAQNASAVAGEIMQAVYHAAAAKRTPLVPSTPITPLSPPRYEQCPPDKLREVNSTNRYGADGGFVILQNMWSLEQDETVYDVVPGNPRMSLYDWILTILSAGMYWLMYLRRRLQYKTSHMVTDRRLISHTLRITWNTVRYSSLEMWLLAPIKTFTLSKTTQFCTNILCKSRSTFKFVAENENFGVLSVNTNSEPFIKTILKVLTEAGEHSLHKGAKVMNREQLHNISQINDAVYTMEFLGEDVAVEASVGSTLPPTCTQKLCCKTPMKFTFTLTSNGILVEAFDRKRRIFTFVSWELVTGSYWSNFQAHSDVCFWHNSAGFITPVHGYSGAQIRICIDAGRSFGIGILLPSRYFNALNEDAEVNDFVTALSHRVKVSKNQLLLKSAEAAMNEAGKA